MGRDLFADLVRIGNALTNESRIILNLLLADQEKAARNRIIAGRKRLQPLERELEKGIDALERLKEYHGKVTDLVEQIREIKQRAEAVWNDMMRERGQEERP